MYNEPDTVLAFLPNRHEGYYFVAEYNERDSMYGALVNGAQCENCGESVYEIEKNGLMPKFGACRCCGCNQRYRIVHKGASEVIFPA